MTKPIAEELFYIWSNEHKAWWRPDSKGYVVDIRGAGKYPKKEAYEIVSHVDRGTLHIKKAPDETLLPVDIDQPENKQPLFTLEQVKAIAFDAAQWGNKWNDPDFVVNRFDGDFWQPTKKQLLEQQGKQ